MRETYLITGGAGFIGSHLTEALLQRGNRVLVLDDLSTGSLRNLAGVASHPNLEVEVGSVLDDVKVDRLVHRADVVVHLAAAVGVKLIIEEPLQSFATNIRGSEIVITSAHRYRRKVLLASTSEVYGKNDDDHLTEAADRILGPTSTARWAYSTAKAVDETLALNYHRERDLPVVIVRLFNTVGPRQSPGYGMVVPRLARQAVAGQSLSVYGDGQQSRCFCHVEDVVRALVALLEQQDAVGNVFNVGSTQEITILDLAQRVIDAAGSSSGIDLIPYERAYAEGFEDMRRRVPDTTKLHDFTGWEPRRSLDDILADAIADARRAQLREGVVDLTLEEALDAHAALSAEPRRFDSDDREATDESRQRAG